MFALFVRTQSKWKVIAKRTCSVENLVDCLSVKIESNRSGDKSVSCIYRTPGSCLDEFMKKTEMYERCNEMFTCVCGDFTIDLLKCNQHIRTTEFVDLMFSLGFYPLILRHTNCIDLYYFAVCNDF